MQSPVNLPQASGTKSEAGTLMTCRSLVDVDGCSEAILDDLHRGRLDVAYSGLDLTRVSFWIQREPGAIVIMSEGTGIDTLSNRFASSSDPVLSRWRGLIRVFSGADAADSDWGASHHRLLHWATDEEGAESEVRIDREPRQVEAFSQLALEFNEDASLLGLLGRVRARQGFTRIETWHQHTGRSDILLSLVEAHDLQRSMAQVAAEDNELDKRTMMVVRNTFRLPLTPPASLLGRWHAQN